MTLVRIDHAPPIPDGKRHEGVRPMLPTRDQDALERNNPSEDGADGSSG